MPITWVRAKASWSSIERSTWDSAAKLTTASQPSIASRTTLRVLDRAHDQLRSLGQVLAPAGVGELVEHPHLVLAADEAHVGGADEAGGAGDEQLHATASCSVARWAR